MKLQTRQWIHGILAAASGALASAVSGIVTMPDIFNFSHEGRIRLAKLIIVPTIGAVAFYIKQFPTPEDVKIVAKESTAISPDGTVTASSSTTVTTEPKS
jgi:hypothetical protein